ncbi:MAG: GNAT family N-acetyltransferase [Aliarcobacter sp.]|jgi:ribosomal protein S18 acetylase RimI-like enzyme|nr:GNAT family N-acetyltransferase [Aliarcobacter sp.]
MPLKITQISNYTKGEFKQLIKDINISIEPLKSYLSSMAYKHTIDGCFITYLLEEIKENNTIVLGYISFSNTVIESDCEEAKELLNVSKSMKYPIPTLKITRLAISDDFQRKNLGKILIAFAEIKAFIQQESTGCKAIVVDSKNIAIDFYRNANFIEIENYSDDNSIVFMVKKISTIKELKKDELFAETIHYYNEICELCNLDTEKNFLATLI